MSFVASTTTGASVGNNLASIDITLPTGGAGAAAGDFAIVAVQGSLNTTLSSSGWTQGDAQASSNNGVAWFYKFLVGGDLGSTVTFGGGSTQRRSAECVVFRGIDTGTPINTTESPAAIVSNTSSATRVIPSATLSGTRDVATIVGDRNATTGPWTAGGTWNNATGGYNTGSGGAGGNMAYKTSVTGSIGGENWTRTGGAATGAITMTVVLNLTTSAFNGTAAIAETGTVSASGVVGTATGSSISATDTITSAGSVGTSSGAGIAATGTISAAGSVGVAGLSSGAAIAATDTVTATGVVGKSTGASVAGTATTTAAGVVGKSTGASVSETATVTGTGVVGKATGASVTGTAAITATGVVGVSSGVAISATATIAADGTATNPAVSAGASIAATGTITAEGVVGQAVFYFTPPTVARSVPGSFWGRYSVDVGQSVVRINGTLQTLSYPWMGELIGAEGTDWFLGGRTYPVTSAVAAELNAAGYTTTS